jgi:hypothetical protein
MKPLTKEQLRDNAAAMLAFADGKPIQFDASSYGSTTPIWADTKALTHIQDIWHRPRPQPVARPWSKPEDVPLNCWLRICGTELFYLVTYLSQDWIGGSTLGRIAWDNLHGYEYSTDRVTWKPCTVEEQP